MLQRIKLRYATDRAWKWTILLCGASSILVLALIIIFILREAWPAFGDIGLWNMLTGDEWRPSQGEYGIRNFVIVTFYVTFLALIISVPLGILCAIFLAEVAPMRVRQVVRPAVELLVGIPSVVYGLVGMILLLPIFGSFKQLITGEELRPSGAGVLPAAIVLSIMVLPTIISVSEDSIRAVPRAFKEGALALGATRWQTMWHVLLPAARSGILTAIVLGMGRAIGETMAMVMVIGNAIDLPLFPWEKGRTLTGALVLEMGYATDLHRDALFAIGVVLLLFILGLNSIAMLLRRRFRQ
jgi:phosphate transport system permease protein